MVSIDEANVMLNEISEEFPLEFYKKLNGGILLIPEKKLHPKNKNNDLYIMGEYHNDINMGRYIIIYYGSFQRVYGHLSSESFKEKLKKTLVHEFTHHMESLAGEHDLEIKDARNLNKYMSSIGYTSSVAKIEEN